jgi:hypothetical protein
MAHTTTVEQRAVLLHQGDMIVRNSRESVPDPDDRADVARRYATLVAHRPAGVQGALVLGP